MMEVSARKILITGGAGAIGLCTARELRARGAQVFICDIAKIEAIEGFAGLCVDISTEYGAKLAIDSAVQSMGGLDGVVHCAGVLEDSPIADMSYANWTRVMSTHVDSAFLVLQHAWPFLIEAEAGRVVLLTSGAGLYGNLGQANYCAAKMALIGLMNGLSSEGRPYGLLINAVSPVARSQLTERVMPERILRRLSPKAVASCILYLSSASCESIAGIYEVSNGRLGRAWVVSSEGIVVSADASPEVVERVIRQELNDSRGATPKASLEEHMFEVLSRSIGAEEEQR